MQAPLHHAIKHLGFTKLSAMQEQAIEAIATHTHVQLIAPTGSGKTAAFLLPLITKINPEHKHVQVIVIAPTRELILQISSVWKKMNTGIAAVTCYGGHRIESEINELGAQPQIVFGTPGRLNDHINKASFDATHVATVVIDEFDKTLEPKFYAELEILLASMTAMQSLVLASATHIDVLPEFVADFTWHQVEPKNAIKPKPSIYAVACPEKDKLPALVDLLHYAADTTSIVFVNHRASAIRIHETLVKDSIECIYYHGGLSQIERLVALIKFKNETVNILICTDIAARGIDVDGINNVIHYHLPDNEEAYTHRNGRTARQGANGNVYVLHSAEEIVPEYIAEHASAKTIPYIKDAIPAPHWITLTVNAGKKNKLNKIDIVGFLSKQAQLKKGDIGIIDVLDTVSFIAIRKLIWKDVLKAIRGKKIKGKDYIFKVAK
ncbi:MAG: hypothetical protein RL660_1425 [Bacteroidota bacterium]|jgi:superfamily II DNA/RNA helicase